VRVSKDSAIKAVEDVLRNFEKRGGTARCSEYRSGNYSAFYLF
jgi:hypothetical protein